MTKRVRTILLVDDDPNITETAKDILEEAGYAVETAGTCAAALATLSAQPIDLAIIDFNLPDGKGVELSTRAKALIPALIILLMTGEQTVDLGPAALIIQSVLQKPVNPGSLIQLLQRLI